MPSASPQAVRLHADLVLKRKMRYRFSMSRATGPTSADALVDVGFHGRLKDDPELLEY